MKPVLLVTGGSRGIGAATARLAAQAGWAVAVNYTQNSQAADEVVRAIRADGGQAISVQADVGGGLVNNAGIVDLPSRVDEMSWARLERMMRINVLGSMVCAREAVRRMSTRHGGQGGAIVNLSSAAAKLGAPNQYVDYAASKGAIDSMTVGLAKEVAAEGIRVNGVRPGIIDTDIHASGGLPDRAKEMAPQLPMRRAGTSEEVAQAIVWLLSDASSYTTGSCIEVTGGR